MGALEGLDALLAAAELSGGQSELGRLMLLASVDGEAAADDADEEARMRSAAPTAARWGLGGLGGGLGGLGAWAAWAGCSAGRPRPLAPPPEFAASGRFALDLDGQSDEATEQVRRDDPGAGIFVDALNLSLVRSTT